MLLQTWLVVFALYLMFMYITEGFCLFLLLNIVRWDGKLGADELLHPDEMVYSSNGVFRLNAENLHSFVWMLAVMCVAFLSSLLGILAIKSAFRPMPRLRVCLWVAVPISFLPLFPLHLLDQTLFDWVSGIVTIFVAASTMITISLALFVGLMEKEFHEKTPKKSWTLWNVIFDA